MIDDMCACACELRYPHKTEGGVFNSQYDYMSDRHFNLYIENFQNADQKLRVFTKGIVNIGAFAEELTRVRAWIEENG